MTVALVMAGQAASADVSRTRAGREVTYTDFGPANFHRSTQIDHRWSPLVPGTQLTLQGTADRGVGSVPHRVVFTVTGLTKVINGVRSRVIWDRDYTEGTLVEAELAFNAQDDDGNVWNLGEYPEEYENGTFVGAPSTWSAGLSGSDAGILMRAHPRTGSSSYVQGSAPTVDFLDRAQVYRTGQRVCVSAGCYDDVLVTREWSPLERGSGDQFKYYAPGIGNIRIDFSGDREKETLELTRVATLSPRELAVANAEALRLDRNGYRVSPDVYAQTAPAER